MKKLPKLLNTPAGAVIAVGMLIIVAELLIMTVIEHVIVPFVTHEIWNLLDPILLIAIVSPALYFLVFRPMHRQQAELEVESKKKSSRRFRNGSTRWMR